MRNLVLMILNDMTIPPISSEDIISQTPSADDDELDAAQTELFEHFRIVVDKGQEPIRIDKYLFDHMIYTSRNRIQRAAEAGCIHVNEKVVKSNYKVRPLDVITLMLDRPRHDNTIYPEDIPLDIVYEDEALMVINKPAGLVVHPGVGNFTGTLINAVAWHLRDDKTFDANNPEVGLVHRIDKDTSGLLVVAKTPDAKTSLGGQFFNKTTRRTYYALVWGNFIDNEGRIEGNIARNPKDRMQMAVFAPDSGVGKAAVTHYRVLERYGYTTLVECRLETGRTHQIRVHMAYIGHPILGDTVYGNKKSVPGLTGQCLHAVGLQFLHPRTGELVQLSCPLPEEFTGMLRKIDK